MGIRRLPSVVVLALAAVAVVSGCTAEEQFDPEQAALETFRWLTEQEGVYDATLVDRSPYYSLDVEFDDLPDAPPPPDAVRDFVERVHDRLVAAVGAHDASMTVRVHIDDWSLTVWSSPAYLEGDELALFFRLYGDPAIVAADTDYPFSIVVAERADVIPLVRELYEDFPDAQLGGQLHVESFDGEVEVQPYLSAPAPEAELAALESHLATGGSGRILLTDRETESWSLELTVPATADPDALLPVIEAARGAGVEPAVVSFGPVTADVAAFDAPTRATLRELVRADVGSISARFVPENPLRTEPRVIRIEVVADSEAQWRRAHELLAARQLQTPPEVTWRDPALREPDRPVRSDRVTSAAYPADSPRLAALAELAAVPGVTITVTADDELRVGADAAATLAAAAALADVLFRSPWAAEFALTGPYHDRVYVSDGAPGSLRGPSAFATAFVERWDELRATAG